MTEFLYLATLLVSTGCMALLDHRFRLVLWRAPRAGVITVAIGIAFFLAWDLAAIASQHYAAGQSEGMTGIMLAPELPLEEIVFITFLSYLTLVLRGLIVLVLRRAGGGGLTGSTGTTRPDAGRPAPRPAGGQEVAQ
ncbi:lycopene cyclase domain-containing protein [Citricoccus sp. K5]|uniref:lycopene cyclase domain-containing protein n=1 Tax=Citricoccus sp. K5 TaxID=2653135 RepID=UPI0012EF5FAC|nr:lycopene cyclase domain-containing protein [Citricoccus sp. K5]VXC07508.1 Lycopene cyclase domain-containing protein [Citricoccus sp. K5]